ncbi:MAG: zinc ABC transporter substrate-binding protein [Clostridia bacterium]|nr:zinc ABC transporter substrate-binding protein [Clostridia bacterium]
MKKIISLMLFFAVVIVSFVGCAGQNGDSGKIKIVATLFPQYDFANIISGGKAEVTMLLPYGIDSHTYEPSVKDMSNVSNCDIFLYTGDKMEPWSATILENAGNEDITAVDLSKNIKLLEGVSHNFDNHGEKGHIHDYDPHIWTSPKNAIVMVDEILNALCDEDEENAQYYIENAKNLKAQLTELDGKLADISENYDGTPLYFGGKFAFLYMFSEYGFKYESPYQGCSDESEPSIKIISDICKKIESDSTRYIFTEEMSENKVAKSISEETDTELLVLHSCHNLSKNEAMAGENYISLMQKNIQNIRKALYERRQ